MRAGMPPEDDVTAAKRRDILVGLGQGAAVAAVALVLLYAFLGTGIRRHAASAAAPSAVAAAQPSASRRLDFGAIDAPGDVSQVAAWVVREADNGSRAFAIVDKRRAQVYVFAAHGRLIGTSPVLLGYAAGDLNAAGIGDKAIEDVKPHERTTPAGRFQSAPGRNTLGDDVVWVDYDAAVSMHRVRATNPKERRMERLATPTAADNRISWGCINVPVAFFDDTVWPHIGRGRGLVYVLPERQPLTAFFPAAAATQHLAQAAGGEGNNTKP
jgi:hypothetical protein